mmetsp:Transcript_31813/g.56940  ORF Transcript_31813/g.56940 Transcript_31813/m.56940 type:complete len:529 (-) Transcript_31813:158-1744(-)
MTSYSLKPSDNDSPPARSSSRGASPAEDAAGDALKPVQSAFPVTNGAASYYENVGDAAQQSKTPSGRASPVGSDEPKRVATSQDGLEVRHEALSSEKERGVRRSNGPSRFEVWERCCVTPCIVGTPIRASSQHKCKTCLGYFHAPCALKASGSDEINNCGCVERAVAGWASSGGPVLGPEKEEPSVVEKDEEPEVVEKEEAGVYDKEEEEVVEIEEAEVVDGKAGSTVSVEAELPEKLKPRPGLAGELLKAWLDGVDLRNKARKPPGKYRGEAAQVWLEAVNVRRRYRRAERSRANRLEAKRGYDGDDEPPPNIVEKKAKILLPKLVKHTAKTNAPLATVRPPNFPSMPLQQNQSATQLPVEAQGFGVAPPFYVPEHMRGAMALWASAQGTPTGDTPYGPVASGSSTGDERLYGAHQMSYQAQQAANFMAAAAYGHHRLPSSIPFPPLQHMRSPTVQPAGGGGQGLETTPVTSSAQQANATAEATTAPAATTEEERRLTSLIKVAENENLPSDLREDASKKIRVLLGL